MLHKTQDAIHRRHWQPRQRLMAQLLTAAEADDDHTDIDSPHPARKLASRLASCCRHPKLLQDNATGQLIYVPGRCNCRICPLCGPIRAAELESCIREHVAKIDSPRMLTLTLKSIDAPLADQIARLRACFREFRRRADFKAHIKGGIAVVEVTYNKKTDEWHPHLHCLVEGTYWAQAAIANAWERTTGDSRIVDVRMITSREAAAKYVAKYVAKATETGGLPDRRITEKALAFSGLRVAQPFGCLHGAKTKSPKIPRPEGIRELVLIDVLQRELNAGSKRAWQLATAIRLAVNEKNPRSMKRHQFLARKITRFLNPPPQTKPRSPPPPPPELLWTEHPVSAMILR